jgi:oxalate decarboxylase
MSITDAFTRTPQPTKDGKRSNDPGPRNLERDRQNPDLRKPPTTDHGTIPNLRFSFSDIHNGWRKAGAAREVARKAHPLSCCDQLRKLFDSCLATTTVVAYS